MRQEAPSTTHDAPRPPQDGPKTVPRWPKTTPAYPKREPKPSRTLPSDRRNDPRGSKRHLRSLQDVLSFSKLIFEMFLETFDGFDVLFGFNDIGAFT